MPSNSTNCSLASISLCLTCFSIVLLGVPIPAIAWQTATAEAQAPEAVRLHVGLVKILKQQQAAWNGGSIENFMSAYWKSEQLTFSSGGETQRGWNSTRDRYLKRYPTKDAMGQLAFTKLETSALGPDHALMLGHWKLTFAESETQDTESAQGNFSLVWKKIDGSWKIIHDHSSSLEKPIASP